MKSSTKGNPAGRFPETRWTLIAKAGSGDTGASQALEELCRLYWFPSYAFFRWRGRSPEDAEDLTQSLFSHLLERGDFGKADRDRGKFRSYLLGALKHFLANSKERENAVKRGGGWKLIPIDQEMAEIRLNVELRDDLTPDKLYDRMWATTLLDYALRQLRHEQAQSGKEAEFAVLEQFLSPRMAQPPYAEAAECLGLSEGAARAAVFRLRKRYQKLLREEILHTVRSPADVDAELDDLMSAFRDPSSSVG